MKVAKSRAKTEDPEQAKLKAKAKEVSDLFLIFFILEKPKYSQLQKKSSLFDQV